MRPNQALCLTLTICFSLGLNSLNAQSGTPNPPPDRPIPASSTPPPTVTLSDTNGAFIPPQIPANQTSAPSQIEINDLRGSQPPQIPQANSAAQSTAGQPLVPSGVSAQLSDGGLKPNQPPAMQTTTQPPVVQPIADAQPLSVLTQTTQPTEPQTIQQQSYNQSVLQQNTATGYDTLNPASTQSINPAVELLDDFALEPQQSSLPGQPMELLDILANADVSKKREIVKQYWNTYAAWANFRCAQMELNWLRRIEEPVDEIGRLTYRAAESAAQDQLNECRIKLTEQQNHLNSFLVGPKSELLPLPSDAPLVGNYRTNFELYAAHGQMPDYLKAIHVYLPEQKMLIANRAATVRQCRRAVMRASQMYSQRAVLIGSVLSTIDLARRNQQAFVASVTDYNQKIGQYALAVKPNQSAPDQIVAMLIPARTGMPMSDLSDMRHATLPQEYRSTNPQSLGGNQGVVPANTDPRLPPYNQPSMDRSSGNFAPPTQYPSSSSGGSLPPMNPVSPPSSGGFQPSALPNSNFNPPGSASEFQPPTNPGFNR